MNQSSVARCTRAACIVPVALLLPLLCAARAGLAAGPAPTADLVKEVVRSDTQVGHFVSFWWLPVEFWETSAREQQMSAEKIEEIRRVFASYTVLAALEGRVGKDKRPELATTAELVPRLRVTRNGEPVAILQEVNPRMAELAPELIYPFQTALSRLGEGLRLLPIANVDHEGRPILNGAQSGELRVEFKDGDSKPVEFIWRGPLTAVAGRKTCPTGGEPLEASWAFCPWHGVKLVPTPQAKPTSN